MFSSDDGHGRMIINKTTNYVSVVSSIIFGAIANGDLLNHKAYLFSEMIDYFLDFQTSIEDAEAGESSFILSNYPNPFSKTTTIKYTTSENTKVSIDIYNTVGQFVKRLVDKEHTPGDHSVTWDATNNYNNEVASGIYYIMIKTGNTTEASKMILSR